MFAAYVPGHPYFGQAPNIDPSAVSQPPVGDGGSDATWVLGPRVWWTVEVHEDLWTAIRLVWTTSSRAVWRVINPKHWTRD